jgi:hypothetical protein
VYTKAVAVKTLVVDKLTTPPCLSLGPPPSAGGGILPGEVGS